MNTNLTALWVDTVKKVEQLCYKATHLHNQFPNLPSVATAFPSGNATLQIKINDTKEAIENGANEVDMVISRGKFHSGEYNYVFDEIAAIKDVCGENSRLKVILETGELGDYDHIRMASEIAINAGADFIKTSTGKISPAATLPITLVMLEAINYLKFL